MPERERSGVWSSSHWAARVRARLVWWLEPVPEEAPRWERLGAMARVERVHPAWLAEPRLVRRTSQAVEPRVQEARANREATARCKAAMLGRLRAGTR